MKQSHTPGPWHYVRLDEWSHRIATKHGDLPDGTPNYWTVADVNKQREPEHEANAALISAAPELLEALQPFVSRNSSGDTITITVRSADIARARAAIAKATGGSQCL